MISIIITVYNLENYIKKCIDSVLNQTYKNLEIIIVNDCSTDGSEQIIKNYQDARIKLINNKENVGAGMSRRIGIENSHGEYVMLLDGDDYLNKDFIEKLYQGNSEYDIITSGVNIVNDKDEIIYVFSEDDWEAEGYDKYNKYINKPICFLNNNLVKKSLYDKVEYCDRRFTEDTPTLMKLLYYADKLKNISYIGYNYLKRENSLTNSSDDTKKSIFGLLFIIDMIEFFKDKPDCFLHDKYTFLALKKEITLMKIFGLLENVEPYLNEWNYIVNYIRSNNKIK